jgi:hypothetical protein
MYKCEYKINQFAIILKPTNNAPENNLINIIFDTKDLYKTWPSRGSIIPVFNNPVA